MEDKKLDIMLWLKSPYILWSLIAIVAVVGICLMDRDTHFVDRNREATILTFNQDMEFKRPGEEQSTLYNAATPFKMLGRYMNRWIVEDPDGNRMYIARPKKDTYTLTGPLDETSDGSRREIKKSYHTYIKADAIDKIAIGKYISEFIDEYGDCTNANPSAGRYEFTYLYPLVDGTRYESGLLLNTDSEGKIVSSGAVNPKNTSKNFFNYLPFFDTIVSWNLVSLFSGGLYEDIDPETEDNDEGFVSMILGWIWGVLLWFIKLALLLLIIGLVFILPTMAVCSLTGPMIHIKSISDQVIGGINAFFAVPLLYILLISFTDAFHEVWIVALPIFLLMAVTALTMTVSQTIGRRCSQCRSVDSIKSTTVQLDQRTSTRYETRKYADDKLKHKGYSLSRGREEWTRNVSYATYLITTVETDWRDDWHCEVCGHSGSRVYTTTKETKEFVDSRNDKEIWIEKN